MVRFATSAFHFTGTSGAIKEIERNSSSTWRWPPSLKFTVYFLGKFTSRSMLSGRFDVKSRTHAGDLESRRDLQTVSFSNILGDVRISSPRDVRGRELIFRRAAVGIRLLHCLWGYSRAPHGRSFPTAPSAS